MNTYNFDVNFTTGRIYGPDLLLVVNDHNSTTFKFTFDQEGRYVFKLLYPDNTIYVQDIIDGELVLTKGVLNQEGNYKFEISLYGDDNRLTTARIKEFPVRLELVETDEPVQADDRLPILDNLIEETNKVVEAAKNGDFDGATFTPSVSDNGDLSWTNDKGKENPPAVNIKGEKGDPGAVKMQVVDTLPQVGDTDTIYLLKKDTPDEQNLYDEYVYTEASGWEHIGDTSVDLTDYYTREETDGKLDGKQDMLTAGNNITIDENNVISASGGNIPTYVYADYTVPTGIISDEKFLSEISQNITNCLTSGASAKARIDLRSGTLSNGDIVSVAYTCSSTIKTTSTGFVYYSDNQWLQRYIETDHLHHYMRYKLMISGTWSNNVFNATRILSDTYTSSKTLSMVSPNYINENLLTKTNTSSYNPTSDYNPATKKYVDDSTGSKQDKLTPGENITIDENNVISASGGATNYLGYIEDYASDNRLDITNLEKGTYSLGIKDIRGNQTLYLKVSHNDQEQTLDTTLEIESSAVTNMIYFDVRNPIKDISGYAEVIRISFSYLNSITSEIVNTKYGINYDSTKGILSNGARYNEKISAVTTDTTQVIRGEKTFNVLPESSVEPTNDNQFVNKKYVDDAIVNAITNALGGSY